MLAKRVCLTVEESYLCWSLWFIICFDTLGFPNKYLERLDYFEDLIQGSDDPGNPIRPWTQPKTFSDRGEANGNGQKTMRQKQQEEWDRLNIAVRKIKSLYADPLLIKGLTIDVRNHRTSAAALAIQSTGPSPNQVYWLVTAFYSAAFGMSLQGLILITYVTISAGGSSDEAIGRLAKGELFKNQPTRPVAFMMALPAILATYSAFALLGGLVAMVVQGPGESVATKSGSYIAVAMVPIGTTFLCLCFSVLLCEIGTWVERHERKSATEGIYLLPKPESPIGTAGLPVAQRWDQSGA